MKSLKSRIVLVDQTSNHKQIDWVGLELDEKEAFILDPIKLFTQIDWTKFENSVDVINIVYSDLFDAVVIGNRPLACYWPSLNFPDDLWIELFHQCKSARVKLEMNYTIDVALKEKDMLPEFQQLWKRFVLFMVESLCEDILINASFEEIASLKKLDKSILLFRIVENGKSKYSYFFPINEVFELGAFSDIQKNLGIENMPSFTSFEHLLDDLQDEIDLANYSATFINRSLEKSYFSSLRKKSNSSNLIKHWIENYFEN